jgi:hypothetical protein
MLQSEDTLGEVNYQGQPQTAEQEAQLGEYYRQALETQHLENEHRRLINENIKVANLHKRIKCLSEMAQTMISGKEANSFESLLEDKQLDKIRANFADILEELSEEVSLTEN